MKHAIRSPWGDGNTKMVNLQPLLAVRLHCQECRGWERAEIWGHCGPGDSCQLYPFRNGKRRREAGSVLKAIRRECLSCMGSSAKEVKHCPDKHCSLFPYRFGRNPGRKGKVSRASLEALSRARGARRKAPELMAVIHLTSQDKNSEAKISP